MRIKSKTDGVFFEPWQTPFMFEENLYFEGILHIIWHTHFCVSISGKKDIYVITIPTRDVYQVITEAHSKYLEKYFECDLLQEEKDKYTKICRTWKIWGTNFIKEVDKGYGLSDYEQEHNKKIFQCLIKTKDKWIEFISPSAEWKVFSNTDFATVVNCFIKNDAPKPISSLAWRP